MEARKPDAAFWEDKNYNKFAKEWLKQQLPSIKETKDDVVVKVDELKTFDGSASVSIKKGKQIFLFDIELYINYTASRVDKEKYTAADEKEVTG